jgi:hypothetical protein
MNENCEIDYKNKIKIPQNNKFYFIIEKSKNWVNSIDIKIKTKEEIDFLNLFLIIKSFIKNTEFFCYKITTLIIKEENDIIITENLILNQFVKMSYWEFEKWIIEKITFDKKYITDDKDFYGIRIVFSKKIIENLNKKYNIETLEYLKPKYPWKKEILKEISIENYFKKNELEKIKEKIEKGIDKKELIAYINELIKK